VKGEQTCRVVGCETPRAHGISVCLFHEREWDRRHTLGEFKAMSAEEKHQDWVQFLATAVQSA
jgi:hypothetical protein